MDPIQDKKAKLAEHMAQVAKLQQEIENERNARLAKLHTEFDCKTTEELVALLRPLCKKGKRGPGLAPELKALIRQDLASGLDTEAVAAKHRVAMSVIHGMRRGQKPAK